MFITFAAFLVSGETFNALIMYFNKVPDFICTYQDGKTESCDWETACKSESPYITGIEIDNN